MSLIDKVKCNNLIEIGLEKDSDKRYVYAKKDNTWHNASWVNDKNLNIENNEISNEAMAKMIGDAKREGVDVYSYPMNTLKGFRRML